MWKGSVSFGLVSIPVEMFLASREREFKFVLLHDKDFSPIRYARICQEEEKEIPWSHIVKGYESEKGKMIVMSEEDFQQVSVERSDTIDISRFADEHEIDSIYFEKPYYLQPQRGASKAYALLVAVLRESGKVGIATYAIHNRGHIGIVKAHGNILLLNQLRYDAEIVKTTEIKAPKSAASSEEMAMALQLVDSMTGAFKPEDFKDTYVQGLRKIIQRKAKGQRIEVTPPKRAPAAKVYDIMSALKASLEEKKAKKRA